MNYRLFSLFIMMFFSSFACIKAQTVKGQSEIQVGVGTLSAFELSGFERPSPARYQGCPIFAYLYRYYLSRKTSIGVNVVHQDLHILLLDNPLGNREDATYTLIAPEMTFWYVDKMVGQKKKALRLYWAVLLGITLGDFEQDTGYFPGLQLTPFGIRYGKDVAWYCEFGFGSKGMVNMGLSYRPPGKHKR